MSLRWLRASEPHSKWAKGAKKCVDFLEGVQWTEEEKAKDREYQKNWEKENKDKVAGYKRKYRKENPIFKLKENIRTRIYLSLQEKNKSISTIKLLGCSIEEYKLYLEKQFDVFGAGLFQYITFRSGMAVIFSLLISTIYGKRIINYLRNKQVGETVRELGLDGQAQKSGTPTMGGIIIIISTLIPVLLIAQLQNIYILLLIFTTLLEPTCLRSSIISSRVLATSRLSTSKNVRELCVIPFHQ